MKTTKICTSKHTSASAHLEAKEERIFGKVESIYKLLFMLAGTKQVRKTLDDIFEVIDARVSWKEWGSRNSRFHGFCVEKRSIQFFFLVWSFLIFVVNNGSIRLHFTHIFDSQWASGSKEKLSSSQPNCEIQIQISNTFNYILRQAITYSRCNLRWLVMKSKFFE